MEITLNAQNIISIAALLGALGSMLAIVLKVHKWYLRQEEQDKDIKKNKDELRIVCKGVMACLDGLEQLGCNHSVPKAKEELHEHINKQAHD